jgi:hypothetical protein
LRLIGKSARAKTVTLLVDLKPLYVTTAAGLCIAQYTELNLLPVFPSAAIGRLLTDIAIGLGPSFIHDLKPKESGMTLGS